MDHYFFQAEQMSVGYDGIPLLENMTFGVEKGEILTLIGPNGAGKSTILKSITKQLAPLAGTMYLDGKNLGGMSEKELAKQMAVLFTQTERPEMLTCGEVVEMGRYPYTGTLGILSKEDHKKVEEAMDLVKVKELRERPFRCVSDGQRQRVMLARAICQEPDILVLDEPTSFLDIRYKLEFFSILQTLVREKKMTVVQSLHELDLAQRVSDQILCVSGEHIISCGTPEEIFQKGRIEKLYGITTGRFMERTGRIELAAPQGKPNVFVIAGGGSGISVYRELQRKGIPFATGILQENDLDFESAEALASVVIYEKAFSEIRESSFWAAKEQIQTCEKVLCPLQTFGKLNEKNRELLEYAHSLGKI